MSILAPFDYHTATTVDEAIVLLQRYGHIALTGLPRPWANRPVALSL